MARKYKKYDQGTRERVLAAARNFGNWQLVAETNGVVVETARKWVQKALESGSWESVVAARGGRRNVKMGREHVEYLVEVLEENPQLTLKGMSDELLVKFNIVVSTQTVKNAMDAICNTVKQPHYEPAYMNCNRVKLLRQEYVVKIIAAQAAMKKIVYFDETNFNLFTARNRGWSRRGTRARVIRDINKGENLNVIAAISADGLEHATMRFGTNKTPQVEEFVRELISVLAATTPINNIVLVYDNAPIHNTVKHVAREAAYAGLETIQLSPYPPMLNPIENAFSTFKSGVKAYIAERRRDILAVPVGTTTTAHRAHHLRQAAALSLARKVTPDLCKKWAAHTLAFHAGALQLMDVAVGA